MAKPTSTQTSPQPMTPVELRASAKALPLPSGLFLFTVTGASPVKVSKTGDLHFPALHVAPGPGSHPRLVEFIGVPTSMGTWLYHPGDKLVVKVEEPGATLILTSVRAEGTQPLDIDVGRLDGRAPATTSTLHVPATGSSGSQKPSGAMEPADASESLKLQLGLHVRNRGDVTFTGSSWAGQLAENLWVEAMSITLHETLTSKDIEYKGLSANGFETPWLSDGATCGTKGISLPLIGFAIRLKAEAASTYDCEYSGYFQSGTTVGPLRNGVPCRSKTASDPLVGIRLRVAKRAGAKPAPAATAPKAASGKGPQFSKFREGSKEAAKAPAKKPERRK